MVRDDMTLALTLTLTLALTLARTLARTVARTLALPLAPNQVRDDLVRDDLVMGPGDPVLKVDPLPEKNAA
eukprot:scaffold44714_cov66-Phaeocystis_antarctica.AAC.1